MTYIIYLDRYHLGDPLFLNRLARDVAALPAPSVLVHGAGEDAERALEAEGLAPGWRNGVLTASGTVEQEIVERAARDLNRRIVTALNDAGVAAVRLDGASRGLLAGGGPAGVTSGAGGWLAELVASGAVPVVAALAPTGEGPLHQVNGGAAAATLAGVLPGSRVVFFSRGGMPAGEPALADLAEPESAELAIMAGAEVYVAGLKGISASGVEAKRLEV
jgi:acetylglutamate kinase